MVIYEIERDEVYSDLSEKYKNKAIKKADYDQLKRIEKIRPNINKVTNILELRSKLQNKLKNLEDEKKSISGVEASLKKIANAEKQMEKIEEEHKKFMEAKETLQKKLKNPELSKEEQTKLQTALSNTENSLKENDKLYVDTYQILKDKDKYAVDEKEFSEKKATTEKSIMEISSKISKCNMVGNNLMNGASWDSIDLKLQNWEKVRLTSKEKVTKKIKGGNESKAKEDLDLDELSAKIVKQATKSIEEEEAAKGVKEGIDQEEKSLTEVSEFEKKHPRLARIGKWVKSKWNAIRGKDSEEEKTTKKDDSKKNIKGKDAEIEEKEEKPEENISKEDEFRQYLKDVAEKGMKQTAREKLDKAKEDAYKKQEVRDQAWKDKQKATREASAQSQEEDRG